MLRCLDALDVRCLGSTVKHTILEKLLFCLFDWQYIFDWHKYVQPEVRISWNTREDALAVEEGAWWRAPNAFRTSFSTDDVDREVVALLKDEPLCSIAADNSSILPRISLSTFPAELDAMFIPRDTFWRENPAAHKNFSSSFSDFSRSTDQKTSRPLLKKHSRSAKNFSTNKDYSRPVQKILDR